MAKITPEEFADKLVRRLSAATSDIAAGVDRVSEAPTAKAAAKKDKMLRRLTEKVQDGTWESRLKAVTTEEWKTKMKDVGVPRISQGIEANRDKVRSFAEQLLRYQDQHLPTIRSMPDVTIEDSVRRAEAWIKTMAKFRKK